MDNQIADRRIILNYFYVFTAVRSYYSLTLLVGDGMVKIKSTSETSAIQLTPT
jgi:hypothetical protein